MTGDGVAVLRATADLVGRGALRAIADSVVRGALTEAPPLQLQVRSDLLLIHAFPAYIIEQYSKHIRRIPAIQIFGKCAWGIGAVTAGI